MVHDFQITVDTPAIPKIIHDTICLGQTQNVDLTFPGSAFYHYAWSPATYVSSTSSPIVAITPATSGDFSYNVTIYPGTGPEGCSILDIVNVHTAPNDFILDNHDTIICRGAYVEGIAIGSVEFKWLWEPSSSVSDSVLANPTLQPTVTTTYSVLATYGIHCAMTHHFTVTVDTQATPVVINDTICLGMVDNINLTFPGSSFYHYSWSPATYVSSTNSAIVVINPAVIGDYPYTVTVYPGTNPLGCSITDMINLHVAPNDFTLFNPDTAICLGQSVQVRASGSGEFKYYWRPTSGVSVNNIIDPIITPTVTTIYTITGTYAPHCPDMHHNFRIEVDTLAHPVVITDTICCLTAA
jgi:hypothetical protein